MEGRRVAVCALLGITAVALWDLLAVLLPSGTGPCQLDDEGSWAIGLYRGPSPLNLTPTERVQPRVDGPSAWPVANPILTCASVTDAPSNFVADPFLWMQPNGSWYLFFETKTNTAMQGDIGVAESVDGGASWRYLGLALDEPWHLSYPFVFQWEGQVYMLPEGFGSGGLRLYKAVQFPLRWELQSVLVERPLIDTSLVEWEGRWWMFTSDLSRRGATKSGELELYYAETPLGPWHPHALNPVMNGDKRAGARMGGRLVPFQGGLLRFGQDCGDTYGHKVVAYRVERLTPTEFQQSAVPLQFGQSRQGRAAWNGMRHHHVDAQQLPDGSWVAVMDGDSQPSGPISSRLRRAAALLGAAWGTALGLPCLAFLLSRRGGASSGRGSPLQLLGGQGSALGRQQHGSGGLGLSWHLARARLELRRALSSAVAWWCLPGSGSSSGSSSSCSLRNPEGVLLPGAYLHSAKGSGWECGFGAAGRGVRRGWRAVCQRVGLDPGSKPALMLGAALLATLAAALAAAAGLWYYLSILWEEPTAAAAVAVGGQLSKFTMLLVMGDSAPTPALRPLLRHYSKCPSVGELVVWSSGQPPVLGEDLPPVGVPVRLRVEQSGSRNGRFRPDPLLWTRAVLQLDAGILMSCADVERGFAAWRQHPDRLVGYQPRLLRTQSAAVQGEAAVFQQQAYNAVLAGAAFMDAQRASQLYWSDSNAAGRAVVDRLPGCEDLLLNFVWGSAAALGGQPTGQPHPAGQDGDHGSAMQHQQQAPAAVLYVQPRQWVDRSWHAKAGSSRVYDQCLRELGPLFSGLELQLQHLQRVAGERWPICGLPWLGCLYL